MKATFVTGLMFSLFALGCATSEPELELESDSHSETVTDQARPAHAVDAKETDSSQANLGAQCGGSCYQGGDGCQAHDCFVDWWGAGYYITSSVTSDCRAAIVNHCHSHGSSFHDAYWY